VDGTVLAKFAKNKSRAKAIQRLEIFLDQFPVPTKKRAAG
jgi:hypothetical protein